MDSKSVRNLLQVMSELSISQRRDFLQFVTGSPKLPIGGEFSFTLFSSPCCIAVADMVISIQASRAWTQCSRSYASLASRHTPLMISLSQSWPAQIMWNYPITATLMFFANDFWRPFKRVREPSTCHELQTFVNDLYPLLQYICARQHLKPCDSWCYLANDGEAQDSSALETSVVENGWRTDQ